MFNILDQEPTVVSGKKKIESFDNSIKIDKVDFEYEEGIKVIDAASFEIPKGKKIAFVGSSGCGKGRARRCSGRKIGGNRWSRWIGLTMVCRKRFVST